MNIDIVLLAAYFWTALLFSIIYLSLGILVTLINKIERPYCEVSIILWPIVLIFDILFILLWKFPRYIFLLWKRR